MQPDLILVNAPLQGEGVVGGVYPSLSNLALAAFLAARGLRVELLDPGVDLDEPGRRLEPDALLAACAQELAERAPRAVGLSTMGTVEGEFAVALAQRLRQRAPAVAIVLGGSWASGFAEKLVERFDCVDAVARGPAEHSLLALLSAGDLSDPGARRRALAGASGWVWRSAAGAVVDSGPARVLRAEESPPLDLSLLRKPHAFDTMVYLSGRGCPFQCAFCTEPQMFPGTMLEPLPKVAADMDALREGLQATYLWVCDPLFGASGARLDALLPHLKRSGLNYLYESRVDALLTERIPDIRAAGGDLVYLGLEASSDRSLLHMGKVRDAQGAARYREATFAVVEACVAADVIPVLGVLNPIPGDGVADLEATLRLLKLLTTLANSVGAAAKTVARPFFHAFPYRLDQGSAAQRSEVADAARFGTRFTGCEDDLFVDRDIVVASHEVDEAAAAAFRAEVRTLNPREPKVLQRVLRSVPRPYRAFSWPVAGRG